MNGCMYMVSERNVTRPKSSPLPKTPLYFTWMESMRNITVSDPVVFIELAAVPRISDTISVVIYNASIFNEKSEHVHLK